MMLSKYFIKMLNATETGNTNTNDSYILVPNTIDASAFFDTTSTPLFIEAKDAITGAQYTLRFEAGREQRIYKLGQYCRDNNVKAGDIVSIEKRIIDGDSSYFINVVRKGDSLVLSKTRDGYFIIRNDVGASYLNTIHRMNINGTPHNVEVRFDSNIKKRADSPNAIPFYKVTVEGTATLGAYINTQYVLFDITNNEILNPQVIKCIEIKQ